MNLNLWLVLETDIKFLASFAILSLFVIIAPPKPHVTILFPLKLIAPIFPNVPTCFFLIYVPIASAQSSTKKIFLTLKELSHS